MAKKKRSLLRRMLGLGVLAGATYAIWRAVEQNRADRDLGWTRNRSRSHPNRASRHLPPTTPRPTDWPLSIASVELDGAGVEDAVDGEQLLDHCRRNR